MARLTTEKQLQTYMKKVAIAHGCDFFKLQCVGQTGFPDVLLIFKGWSVFVELKSPSVRGRLSPRQVFVLKQLTNQGIENYVAKTQREVDLIISRLIQREPRILPNPSI